MDLFAAPGAGNQPGPGAEVDTTALPAHLVELALGIPQAGMVAIPWADGGETIVDDTRKVPRRPSCPPASPGRCAPADRAGAGAGGHARRHDHSFMTSMVGAWWAVWRRRGGRVVDSHPFCTK